METLSLNLRRAREATHNGRPFLVCDATLIVPGVLPGSKGPLLYPADEVRNSAPSWEGTPVVLYHPADPVTGAQQSARSPGVMKRAGMGFVANSRFRQDRLTAETWFDVGHTTRLDLALNAAHRVLPRLRAGVPVELSTGLFTANQLVRAGATWNGRPYVAVARNYRPDHLAVLPDQVGACSVRDGCGVLNTTHKIPDLFGALT